MQDASFIDKDGQDKIWSESNVSEDFDMALRLQLRGYIIRWATYSKGAFKEGVSLTIDDELNRWQKYAYGEWSVVGRRVATDFVVQAVVSCCSTPSRSGGAEARSHPRSTSSCGLERRSTTRYR